MSQPTFADGVERNSRAFAEGCDARLAGKPIACNPYHSTEGVVGERQCYQRWLEGWHDIDLHWGKRARWPVRELPAVQAQDADP